MAKKNNFIVDFLPIRLHLVTKTILTTLCFLFIFFCNLTHVFSETTEKEQKTNEFPHGTLIVSYQTGAKGERLERVRFCLQNENYESEMYPKSSNFVYDEKSMTRTVVIENLAAGKYFLKFLIPNKDNLFKEVPSKEIFIHPDETLKIDQKIKLIK